jgi:PAS domain S-box-containing protein
VKLRRRERQSAVSPFDAVDTALVRELLESTPDALVVVDGAGSIVFVNAQAERLFGYVRSELIGTQVELLVPTELRDEHRRHRETFAAAPKPRPIVCVEGQRKDGSRFAMDISLSPLRTETGTVVASLIRDVTERDQVAAELRRSESLFRGLLESAPDAIVIVDRDAQIVLVNSQAEKLFGYEREELIGSAVEMLLPERVRERHVQHRSGYLVQPSARPMGAGLELLARRKDGSEFPVDISLSPHSSPDSVLVMSSIRDVTEQKRAAWETQRLAAEAERANAAKSEFLSRMSHELRTPLNSVLGFSQVLELDDLTPDQRTNVEYIVRAGRHLLSLINEILDMAQIEAGRLDLSVEPVSVELVVSEALELVAPLAEERGVTIGSDPPAQPVFVLADQQRLLQVLINLVVNAVKYSPSGAEAIVSWTAHEQERARIEVRDSGPGIPSEELERIFAPFERLDAAARTEGTGLGLALATSLVEAMGGSVAVSSTLGEGSTFTVVLTRAFDEHAATARTKPFVPTARAKRTVLHIEDNLVGQRLVERILKRLPEVEFLSSAQGVLGVELARRYRPDLVLLDLHLPDVSGEEVLRRLREDADTRDIPVIVVSADTSREVADRMTREGARAFLTKPIDADVLLTVVDELTRPTTGA